MTKEKGPKPETVMSSFRPILEKQPATQGDILNQDIKEMKPNPEATFFSQDIKKPEDAGIKQTKATQSLAKGQTVKTSQPKPKINADTMKSNAEETSKQGYGNRVVSQSIPGTQAPGSNPQKQKEKSSTKMRTKEQAEDEYVKLAKDILLRNKGQKYIKDF